MNEIFLLKRQLKENLEKIQEKIEKALSRAIRPKGSVKILGASKKQSPEKIRILYELGVKLFGENYVQEGEKKIELLKDLSIEWHFIGRLQTNKVKKAIKLFKVIESLDRIELAKEIEKRAKALNIRVPVFLEVNIGKEKTKGGVLPEELKSFSEKLLGFSHIEVRGLMCLPPFEENPEKVRPYFARMRKLFEEVKPIFGETFTELSMGTSHDFEIAIEEGATLIRLGTILFGKRE
ncbi:MAG: YggS family pyridoxal phosphate-dependent enzyme [Caldimicrobium sp.]